MKDNSNKEIDATYTFPSQKHEVKVQYKLFDASKEDFQEIQNMHPADEVIPSNPRNQSSNTQKISEQKDTISSVRQQAENASTVERIFFSLKKGKQSSIRFHKIQIGGIEESSSSAYSNGGEIARLFLQDDFFLGEFDFADGVYVNRQYLSHTPQHRIYYTCVKSRAPLQCNIIILHGWVCAANYMEIACKFARLGIKAHLFHLSGFGYSGGKRSNCSIKHHQKDIKQILKECEINVPLFLYGHSLGGVISVIFNLLNNDQNISGLILNCPDLAIKNQANRFVKFFQNIFMELAPYIEDSVINPERDISQLSGDAFNIHNQPKSSFPHLLGGRFSYELTKSKEFIQENLKKLTCPVLFLYSDKSKVNKHADAENFLRQISSKDKTLEVIERGSNQMLIKHERELINQTIIQWVYKRANQNKLPKNLENLRCNVYLKRFRKRKITILIILYQIGWFYLRTLPGYKKQHYSKKILWPILLLGNVIKLIIKSSCNSLRHFSFVFKREILFE